MPTKRTTKITRTPAQIAALEKARAARQANAADRAAANVSDPELSVSDEELAAVYAADNEIPAAPVEPHYPTDAEVAAESRSNERDIVRILSNDDKVLFVIPVDPDNQNHMWERSFNGLILRFKRGEPQMQPKYIADYVESCVRLERASKSAVADYQSGSGKKISY